MSHSAISKPLLSPFLDGLDPEDIAAILGAGKELRVSSDTVIVNQGRRAEHLFLLTHGRARHFFVTADGKKLLLRWLVPGDITGAAALLSRPARYQFGTEAVKDSRLVSWHRAEIGRLTTRYPRLLQNMLIICDLYFDWYLTAHIALACDSAHKRCASVLTNIAKAAGQKVAGGIELFITNEELASAASISLFDASRFVSDWHRSGAIVKTRGKIILRSPDLL